MLKSASGWSDTWGESKPEYQGTDDYGFTALPGGARKWNQFETLGSKGTWWTTDAVPDYPCLLYTSICYEQTVPKSPENVAPHGDPSLPERPCFAIGRYRSVYRPVMFDDRTGGGGC